ncbi:MAG TPA: alpha/beta fold hydrolase [Candidatus Limnocylindrales bacterium]|nr:alpha/beta fold hydrolase [Candidatus Limnocylindrales bacterium]
MVLVLVAIGACSGSGATSTPPGAALPAASATPSASSADSSAPDTSSSAPTEFVAGGDRPVTVHVPVGADPAGAPLLLVLHGYSSNGAEVTRWLPLGEAGGRRGVVWAYPDGSRNDRGDRFWNATDACCGFGSDVDDVAYLTELIDEIAARTRIDPARVYVVGHSNGGFMSHRMACDRADKVTAIASISGVTFADPARCAPSAPVAVLQVHGTDDETISFEGGVLRIPGIQDAAYPGAAETARLWLGLDGCEAELTETAVLIDADARVDGTDGPAETTVAESTGCDPGGRVELWSMHGVRHSPAFSDAFPDAVLDFLLAQERP